MVALQGRCLCEGVRFEIHPPFSALYQCHCSQCRKQSGAASNAALLIGVDHFRWLSGQERVRKFTHLNGFQSDFCANCGSPVPNPLKNSNYYWIPAGLLEESKDLAIKAHLHLSSKASWDSAPLQGRCFQTMPDLAEILSILERH